MSDKELCARFWGSVFQVQDLSMTYYYRFRSQFIWGKTNIKNNKEEERKKDYKILVLHMIFLQETSVLYVCRSIAT